MKSAFTMVELIFVIVIIGILASVAIPKFSSIKDGAKKSAEIATISAVATALDSANGEWSINEGSFTWGNHQNSSTLNSLGYPDKLGVTNDPFSFVIKDSKKFKKQASDNNISIFTGPASDPNNGVKYDTSAPNSDIPNKPDKNDFWVYVHNIGVDANCTILGKVLHLGDISLIDVNGTGTTDYSSMQCN